MAAATNGNNPMFLGAILIIGAVLYSRSMTARAGTVKTAAPASMPGNVGSGTNQIIGGVVSSLSTLLNNALLKGFQSETPYQVQPGTAYDPTDPAYVGGLSNLINGTINDYYQGDTSSYQVPTVNEIVFDTVNTTYRGDGSFSDSIRPGAYWS